jgi:hypothetical protein
VGSIPAKEYGVRTSCIGTLQHCCNCTILQLQIVHCCLYIVIVNLRRNKCQNFLNIIKAQKIVANDTNRHRIDYSTECWVLKQASVLIMCNFSVVFRGVTVHDSHGAKNRYFRTKVYFSSATYVCTVWQEGKQANENV